MSKKSLACRHCGKPFRRAAGAGLFCGEDCETGYGDAIEANRQALTDRGFRQHPDTPNIWHKDGVAVTEEQVKHHGIEKVMRLHGSAVAEHSRTP